MAVKAILFDLDNTLVDFWKMKTLSVEAAVSAMIDAGLTVPRARALKIIYRIYDEKGIEYQHIFEDFLKETVGKTDYKVLSAGIQAYRAVKEAYLDPYPHTLPTLIELVRRGYRLGVISDAPRMQAWNRLTAMRLTHFFDVVITADDVGGAKKPATQGLKFAAQRLKLKPSEIALVGDSLERDVAGAKAIGMVAVLARYGKGGKEKGRTKPDYTIEDIAEVLRVFK